MNDNAVLYSEHNSIPRTVANRLLDEYSKLMKWQKIEKVLDVGSGDGSVTSEILLPKLPKTFKKLIGIDTSENMVKFAKHTYRDTPKLDFLQLDIVSQTMPAEFLNHFDHVFTFFCFNWIPEDKVPQALRNIYDMLQPGGQVFMVLISKAPIYDFWENLARDVKWAPYLTSAKKRVSMYHHVDEPEKKIEDFFQKAGFEMQLCKHEHCSFAYPSVQVFRKWSESINPFAKDIPANKMDSYFDDYMKEARKHEMISVEPWGDEEKIYVRYTILIVCAMKPL